jgi:membrane protein YdbS with pleckstrin-like domain
MRSEPIDPEGISWIRISPKFITVQLIGWAIGAVIVVALASVPLVLLLVGVWPGFPAWLAWTLSVGTLLVNLWMGVLIPRQVRAIGYAERDEDLLIRRGIFFQRVMVVPYGRMQYVDVAVGPLERAFGLASVKLHTASLQTNAAIPGVPAAEAARLREQLSARGQARLAGL